jgi:hypothetical protein
VVQIDLLPQDVGVLREAAEVVFLVWPFTPSIAQQELVEDQVEGGSRIPTDEGEALEIAFGQDAVAGLPALALIDAQDRGRRVRRKGARLGQESVHVRPLSLAPQLPQPFGRVAGSGVLRGVLTAHGSLSNPSSRATRTTARASCIRRACAVPPSRSARSDHATPWLRNSATCRSSSESACRNRSRSSRPATSWLGLGEPAATPARCSAPAATRRLSRRSFPVHLLPGQHWLSTATYGVVYFNVDDNGIVDYDAALDLILSGRGTRMLTFVQA